MPQWIEEQYPFFADRIKEARKEGYSDDEIFGYIQDKIGEALDEGYSQQEVFDFLGSPTEGFELLPRPEDITTEPPDIKPYSIQRLDAISGATPQFKEEETRTRTQLPPVEEAQFKRWYKDIAKSEGLDPDPDAPEHKYDYRGAYAAGQGPDETGHWPSQYKDYDHPNRYVKGMDTKTGLPISPEGQQTWFEQEFGESPPQPEQPKAQGLEALLPQQQPQPAAQIEEPPPQRPQGVSDQLIYDASNMLKDIVYPTLTYYANLNQLISKLPYAEGTISNEAAARAFAETFKPPKSATGVEATARFIPEIAGELAPFILSPGGPISKMMTFGVLGSPDSPVSGAAQGALMGGILKALPFVRGMGKRFGAGLAAFGGPQAFNDVVDYLMTGETPEVKEYAKAVALAAMGTQERPGQIREILTEKLTRKTIREGGIPTKYYISPEQLKEMFNKVNPETITAEEMAVVRGLGLDAKGYKEALKRGLDIEVNPEQIIKVVDRPWYAALKNLFKMEPGTEEVYKVKGKTTYKYGEPAKVPPKGPDERIKKPPKQEPETGTGPKGQLPKPEGPEGPTAGGIEKDLGIITKKPADQPIIEKLGKITDLKRLQRLKKNIQGKIDKIENPQARARAQAALDQREKELAAGVTPETQKGPIAAPPPTEVTTPPTAAAPEGEAPPEVAPEEEIAEEDYPEELKQYPEKLEFHPSMKVGDVQDKWNELMGLKEQVKGKNDPQIEKLKGELESLKGNRSPEAKTRKQAIEKEIRRLTEQVDLMQVIAENLFANAQQGLTNLIREKANAKGIEDDEVILQINDDVSELMSNPHYIERVYDISVGQIIDDTIDALLEEAGVPSEETEAEGEGIKPEVTDKDVQQVIKKYIDRIRAEKDPANFVQLRKELEDEGIISDAQKGTINREIDRAEAALLIDETADIPSPEAEQKEAVRKEQERLEKKDKTAFIEMGKKAGVTFSMIHPTEEGDIISFHDPESGGDFSVREKDLTPESLQAELAKLRKSLGKAEYVGADFEKRIEESSEIMELSQIATEVFESKQLSNEEKDNLMDKIHRRQLDIEPKFKGLTQDFAEKLIAKYFSAPLLKTGKVKKVSLIGGVLKKGVSGKDIDVLIELDPAQFDPEIEEGDLQSEILDLGDIVGPGYADELKKLGIIDRADEAYQVVDLWFKLNDKTYHFRGGWDPTKGTYYGDELEDVTGKYEGQPTKEIKALEKEPEEPKKAPTPEGLTHIGKNAKGEDIYEDKNGIRIKVENGITITEKVRIIPTKEGVKTAPPEKRDEEFLTTEELQTTPSKEPEKAGKPEVVTGLPRFKKAWVSEGAIEHYWQKTLTDHGRMLTLQDIGIPEKDAKLKAKTLWKYLDTDLRTKLREYLTNTSQAELRYSEKIANTRTYWDEILGYDERLELARKAGIKEENAVSTAKQEWDSLAKYIQEKLQEAIPSPYEVIAKNENRLRELWDRALSQEEKVNLAVAIGLEKQSDITKLTGGKWDYLPPSYQFALIEEVKRREQVEKEPDDPWGKLWNTLSTDERFAVAKELTKFGKGIIDPDLMAKDLSEKTWFELQAGQRDLIAVALKDRYPEGKKAEAKPPKEPAKEEKPTEPAKEEGEPKAYLPGKLTANQFADQKEGKSLQEWAQGVLNQAGKIITPEAVIEYAGYWEPSKTHPNGAIQFNGPYTESSLNLRTDQFTPENIINKLAWNYLTTDPKNRINPFMQIDSLTNEQKADIIYGRKGVQDVVRTGPEHKKPLEKVPPENVPPVSEGGKGEGVLPTQGAAGGGVGGKPVETRPGARPDEGGSKGPVLPTGGGRTTPVKLSGNDYRITDADNLDNPGTEAVRFDNNITAIRLLKQIEDAKRVATPEEQKALVKYVGWGGLADVFKGYGTAAERNRYAILKQLLTKEEWQSALESTPNAHYTNPKVIGMVYAALKKFGFTGGKVLEPAVGIGNFLGLMPADMMLKSTWNGIELDIITAKIAHQLYQGHHIQQSGYEKVTIPNNYYDLAISNVPFGDYSVFDKEYKTLKAPIHDYYFVKTIDKVRPGGLVAFITSRFTMDKEDSRIRRMISDKADLVFAIRLPDSAFKQSANTEVVTDIIFLRKKVKGETVKSQPWIETQEIEVKDASIEGKVRINEYFLKNPKHVLGKHSLTGSMYAENTYTVKGVLKEDIEEIDPLNFIDQQIEEIIDELPGYKPGSITEKEPVAPTETEIMGEAGDVKNGGYLIKNRSLYRKEGDTFRKIEYTGDTLRRATALVKLKEKARAVVRNQMVEQTEAVEKEFQGLLKTLNIAYDEFVKDYGYIGDNRNWSLIEDDPDLPFLLSIEKYDEKTKKAEKSAFFVRKTIQKYRRPEKAGTAKEALLISLNETATIDFTRMSELTDKTEEELKEELQGIIFKDPDGEKWVMEDEYLSGDVVGKLAYAKAIAKTNPEYQTNVSALEKVQPEPVQIQDVYIRLGQTWVESDEYKEFISWILEDHGRNDIKVDYTMSGGWIIRAKPRGRGENAWSKKNYNQSGRSSDLYTIPFRKQTVELLDAAFNGRNVVIYEYDDDGNKIGVDLEATEDAKRIMEEFHEKLKEWMMINEERKNEFQTRYNDRYNRIRKREFDGTHLTLPHSNPAITLRPHQKNAIWRIISGSYNTLLEHVVGAGKTYVMIASAMEMKRLGVVNKPALACYKHQVPDFEKSIYQLYPAANVLVPTTKDFTPKNRQILQSKIASGDWDLVVMSHEQFEMLPMSLEYQKTFISDQVSELMWGMEQLKKQGARDRDPSVKQYAKAIKRLRKRLEALLAKKRDVAVDFEELGIDFLYIDEAQKYKNLNYITTRSRVSGLGDPDGSDRANDLYMKTSWMTKRNGGKAIVFATATPISNSIVEMYTVLRYLNPVALEERIMTHFDAWAAQFGQQVTAMEVDFVGGGYRQYTRFRQYNNMKLLMQIYNQVSDIQTQEMLKLPVPRIRGGRPEAIDVEASELQKMYVAWLVERAELIKHGGVDPKEDNMLKLTSEGKQCALDLRLVWLEAPDDPGSKLNAAVKKVLDVWKATEGQRSTQLVFCDLGTPDSIKENPFNVYADFKEKLIKGGVPENEIAFIHSYDTEIKKEMLFDEVNSGNIRILMGSTEKMGTGMNVQKKLIHELHLDAPWTPAGVEQREGRIIRQGNENEEVEITRFVTKGTFDAYIWQILENKQGFLGQLKRGDVADTIEDIDQRALSYQEMKALASGDPLVKEKIELEIRLNQLMVKHNAWQKRRKYFEQEAATAPERIEGLQKEIEHLAADQKLLDDNKFEEGKFKMVVEGKDYDERKEAGARIVEIWKGMEPKADLLSPPFPVGNYRGFRIGINKFRAMTDDLVIQGNGKYQIQFNPSQLKMAGEVTEGEVDPVGLIKRIENRLEKIQVDIDKNLEAIEQLKQKAEQAQKEMEKPFDAADELKQKQRRLIEVNNALGLDVDEGLIEDVSEGEEEGEGAEKKPVGPKAPSGPVVARKGEVRLVIKKGGSWITVIGRKVDIRPGFDFVSVKDKTSEMNKFTIYEKRTGIRVAGGYTQKRAIDKAKSELGAYTDENLENLIQSNLAKIEAEGGKPKPGGTTLSEDIDYGYTRAQTDENKIAYGSNAKAKEALYKLAETIEKQYVAASGQVFSENPEEYQSRIANELLNAGRVNLKGNRFSTFEAVGAKELAGMIQAWRDPTMEIVHFILTDAEGTVVLHTAKTSGNIAEVDIGDWQDEIPELFRNNPTATKIHIVHNHPSGKAKLSLGDKNLDAEILAEYKDKYGIFMAIDDGEYEAYVDIGGTTKVRTQKKGNFSKTPGSARWMEREKNFKFVADSDLAGFVKSISRPDRTVVIFHGTQNVIYGWTTISDFALVTKDPDKIKELITDGLKKFHAYRAVIWTQNKKVKDLPRTTYVGDYLSDIIYENVEKQKIVAVGPGGKIISGPSIASMSVTFPIQFDPHLNPFKKRVSVKLFEPRGTYRPENMTEEQLEALERAKEYVRQLQHQAEISGVRFNREYLRRRGFDRRTITQLLKVARLIRDERQRYGTPNENAKKVLETHIETDRQLNELKKFKALKLYRMLKRGIVDVSGNIKPELMKFGAPGRKVVIDHDLVAGATSWAEQLHHEATEKIYGKGEWGKALSSDEEKMLNYLIQSRRIVAIDSYKEKVKHPGRLTGKHHEDFLDYESFARAFRDLTGKDVSEDLFEELQERANRYFEVMDEQLTELFRNGLINQAGYEAMLEIGAYQPRQFIQHIDPENTYTFGGSRVIQVHNSGIKRIATGSFRVLENDSRKLLYQVIARTQGRIARNKANTALWDLATNVPDNGLVRRARIVGVTVKTGTPIFEKTPAGHEAIDVMLEGKKRRLFMPDEWAREWVMRDPSVNDQVANVIGWISGAKILRPMATGMFAPEFAITNLARDAAHLWLTTQAFSKWLPIAGLQYGKALKAVWKDALLKRGIWREYIKEGGGMSFLATQGRMLPNTGSKILDGLEKYGTYLGEFSEVLNRLAIMQQEIWNGKTPREAAWVGRNYIDFYQGGTWAKMLDTGIPYLNAGIQGTRGIFRAMHNDPKSTLIKLGQLFALAIGLYLANRFINPDAYDSISDSDKVRYWNITTPLSFKDSDGTTRYIYFSVAKDQGQRFFAQVAEQMTSGMTNGTVNWDQMAASFRDFWPIMAPQDMLPPTMDALLGYTTNKDFWLNKDIWDSKYYQFNKIESREEYTRYTHPALVKIGNTLNLSPVRLQYALEQFFTYGNIFTALVGGGLRFMMNQMPGNEGERVTEEIIAQLPGIRKVMRVTRPVPDVVRKEAADALRKIYTQKIHQNREVSDWADQYYDRMKRDMKEDAAATLDNVRTYIQKQPKEDQKRLKDLFKEYPLYDDIPDRAWWISLREMPPEAKAYVWYSRYRRATVEKKAELDRLRRKMPGMTSDRFMAELRKLQRLEKESNK